MLPWSLLVLSLVVGLSGVLLEKQKLDAAEVRATAASQSEEKTRAELSNVSTANQALGVRVQELQNELGHLAVKVAARADEPAPPRHAKKARRKHGKSRHHRH